MPPTMTKGALTFRLRGIRGLERRLNQVNGSTRKGVMKLVAVHSEAIASTAKTKAPSGVSSFLRVGITAEYTADRLGSHIGASSRYAPFVEFGTAIRGKLTYPGAMQGYPGRTFTPGDAGYVYGSKHRPSSKHLKRWAGKKLGDPGLAFQVARRISMPPAGIPAEPFLGPAYLIESPKFIANIRKLLKFMGKRRT